MAPAILPLLTAIVGGGVALHTSNKAGKDRDHNNVVSDQRQNDANSQRREDAQGRRVSADRQKSVQQKDELKHSRRRGHKRGRRLFVESSSSLG